MNLSNRLREWREVHGASLTDLHGLTGLSVPYLWRLERDERSASAETKIRIARALGVPVGELFPIDQDRAS